MAQQDDKKSETVKDAEAHGGETYNSEESTRTDTKQLAADACPDCKGEGIRNPDVDRQVCQTCEGSGKA